MVIEIDEFSVKKINLIDKFRERFSASDNEKLKLPQIIVVGDQSSGKSSILEAISGIKLPRGVNTVTKCPVIIQMRQSNKERKQIKCKSYNNSNVENTEAEIRRVQQEHLNDELTEEPITLHIESPNVQTLTIIDLPGIVKTQTSDQATNIVEMTDMIAKMYMKQENSLIICVLPANQDISTTTTIKLATACNPSKSRIIGVLTKLDKIDVKEASLIPGILDNIKIPIKKGFYGLVVSDEFLDLDSANREKFEEQQFTKMGLWTDKNKCRLGLAKLTTALVKELILLINDRLPTLKQNIIDLKKETEHDLSKFSKYHDSPGLQSNDLKQISNGIVAKIDNVLVNADTEISKFPRVSGFLISQNYLNPIGPNATFLFMWNSIYKLLHDSFRARVKELFELRNAPYKELKSLDDLIKECRVDNVLVFNNSKPFRILIGKILKLFKEDTWACVDKCGQIIRNIIENVLIVDIKEHLSPMKTDISEFCLKILDSQTKEINSILEYLFESEESYFSQDDTVEKYSKDPKSSEPATPVINPTKINTSPSMNAMALQRLSDARVPDTLNVSSPKALGDSKIFDNDNTQFRQAKLLKHYLDNYIGNLILRLGDCIPNFIRLTLFVKFKKTIDDRLFSDLNDEQKRHSYYSMNAAEVERYGQLKARLEALCLSQVDFNKLMSPNMHINGVRTDHW